MEEVRWGIDGYVGLACIRLNGVLGSALKFRSGVQRADGHMPTTAHNLTFRRDGHLRRHNTGADLGGGRVATMGHSYGAVGKSLFPPAHAIC